MRSINRIRRGIVGLFFFLLFGRAEATRFLLHRSVDSSAALHGSHAPAFAGNGSNADREVPGLFEGLARTKQAMRDRGMALRMAQRMDRIRDAVDALEGDVESGMERRAAMLEREAMGSQPRLASRQLAHKLAGKPVLRALRKTTTKKALRAVLLNTWTRTRTKTKTRSSTSKTRTRTTSASATKSKSPTATKTKTLTKTPTTTALFTPIPPAPRSTLAPAPPAPRPSVVLNSKAMPIDPALPAPTGPISTVLVSDYSFGLIWGSVATAKQVRHFGARFWDSNMVVRGFAVDCGTVSDLVSLVPDGKVTKSLATPYRAIQVELTPSEASNKLWGCSVRLISGSGIGPQSTALRIGVDLRTGDARIAALRASASAFFDFNAPLSTLQPTSFETHSSLCSDPKTTAAYITSSYLLLTASSSESPLCPPGSSHFFSVKPLGTLDFSGGRTVFISFDTDGVPEWGSQLSVSLIANPSADRDAPGFGTGLPSARQYTSYSADSGQSITLTQTAGGFLTLRQKWTNLVRVSDLEERDLGFGVPGLRRTVVLRVSKGRVRVEVSGVQLMDVAPTMDWDRAQLVFQLSGNSTDDPVGIPVHRVTIDNLHVSYSSAPPAAPIIRDFPFSLGMGSYRAVIPGQQASFAVNVGSLAGATSATLFFSFHGFPNQKEIWEWQNSLCILKPNAASGQVVNLYGYSGVRSIACGPGDAEQSWDAVKAGYGTPRNWPGGWIVKLDPSWIGEGTNYFVFDTLAPLVIGDLHVEVGFAGAAPAYSPQTHWLAPYLTSGNPEPTVAWVGTGPSAKLNYIGSKPVWQNYPLFFGPGTGLKVNGTLLKVDFDAGTWVGGMVSGAAFVTAGCNGVTKVEILVDDRVVRTFSWPNPGMPYVYGWATIDLAAIGDWSLGGRTMKVDVRAYDSRGNPSFPLYNGIAAYRPIGVWSNKSQPAIVTADLGAPGSVKGVPVFPAAVAGTQPAPKGLTVVEDDRVATFSWDNEGYGFYSDYGMRFWGKRVSGYQVSWYPLSNRSQVSKMVTPFRAIQLQPLAPGVRYGAVVQTIDSEEAGRLGPVSAEITFQSNSTRVDQLREICTGFFDDFNLPAGPFDAKKWVTSYSVCTDPLAGANFVNGQLHAHNAVKTSGKCPSSNMSNIYPAMVTSRPIGVLDFTGTVGTIGFDFDGPSATNYWFFDFVPGEDEDRFSFSGPAAQPIKTGPPLPDGTLRLHAAGLSMLLEVYSNGQTRKVVDTFEVRTKGADFVANLRQPFLIKISKDSFTLDIAGKRVIDVPSGLGLPFERGSVHFQQFANVTNANSDQVVTVHWDNMCLSSVTPPRKVIRSYRATNSAEYRLVGPTLDLASNTFTIPIPDDISQATGGRLKFSRQGDRFSNAAFWDGTGIICVNRFAWTGYGVPTVCKVMLPDWMAENRTIGTIQSSDPQGVILQLPKEAIQSSNRIVLTLPANIYIGDMHLEVDFPAGYTGSYTAPVPWFGNSLSGPSFHPAAGIVVGPALRLGKIGGAKLWEPQGLRKAMADPAGVTVNTMMVVVEGEVDAAVGLEMFGKATGILRIELQLDRKVVQTWTFPSPGVLYYYFMTEIDVAGIAPGVHEIFAIAYDASGAASMPSYSFPTNILNNRPTYVGAYFPARITVT